MEETVGLMLSSDYKDRLKAEILQLSNRITGLENMLNKWRDGTLEFAPTCPYRLLDNQLKAMELYLSFLSDRAEIEGVEAFD